MDLMIISDLAANGQDRGHIRRPFSEHILCSSEGYSPTPLSCGYGEQQSALDMPPILPSVVVKFVRLWFVKLYLECGRLSINCKEEKLGGA